MIETINGKAYLKVGDKVYELGGGSNIITADSVEQLPDPASVPEGTIAFVKSEGGGGGGLPVVELSTEWDGQTSEVVLNANDAAKMDAALAAKMPIVLSITTTEGTEQRFVMSCSIIEGVGMFMCYLGVMVSVTNMTGSWTLMQQE